MKHDQTRAPFLCLLGALLAATGCSATTDDESDSDRTVDVLDPAETGGTTGSSTGGTAPVTGGTSSTSSGGTTEANGGSTTDPPEELEVEAFLPMNVTDYFGPSGFMGREGTTNEVEGITMDVEGCTERGQDAAGECFKVEYQPQELAEEGGTWAGVYFQNPELNWGEERGVVVESGASKIVVTAWSESAELEVELLAGGIGNLGTLFSDTFKVSNKVTLTNTPTQYELDMSTSQYQTVLGGFGWVIATDTLDPIVFYIDDMKWVK